MKKHIHAIIATVKVAIQYHPDDNLLLLTTQIKEQARKLTGFVSCETALGKIPAPVEAVVQTTIGIPAANLVGSGMKAFPDVEPSAPAEEPLPDFLKRKA